MNRFFRFLLYKLGLASETAYSDGDGEQHQGLKWHVIHLGSAVVVMLAVVLVSRALGIGLDSDTALVTTVLTGLGLALAIYIGDLYRSRE